MYSFKEVDPTKEYNHTEIWDYVYERDNCLCQMCGGTKLLQQHHIISRGKGGGTHTNNLILMCYDCHIGKAFTKKITENLLSKAIKNEIKFRERMV